MSNNPDRHRRPCFKGHQRNVVFFQEDGFSLIFFIRDAKMKMTPSCSSRRDDAKNVSFDFESSISKSDLRLRLGHDPSWVMHMLQAVWKRSPFANGLGVRPFRNGLEI